MILQIDRWETPASSYEMRRVGDYRLTKTTYTNGGLYSYHFIDGYTHFRVTDSISLTLLQELRNDKWEDWMIDSPMDYRALQKMAEVSKGNVLVAGLGLGLVIHELNKNPQVNHITLVEISKDVIELTYKYLPKDNLTLVVTDFLDFIEQDKSDWDTIIVDIWATNNKEQHYQLYFDEVRPTYLYLKKKYPNAEVMIHGFTKAIDTEAAILAFNRGKRDPHKINNGG